jgi:hypothetical protein
MADYSAIYTLGAITFNNGVFGQGSNDDLYWIDDIHGLDGPTLRFTGQDKPFAHGGLRGRTWKGPRHPVVEGRMIVQSVGPSACQAVFNAMEAALRSALEGMLAPTTGTLAWTAPGDGAHSLTVVYERELIISPADNYRTRHFDFGLFSESADL